MLMFGFEFLSILSGAGCSAVCSLIGCMSTLSAVVHFLADIDGDTSRTAPVHVLSDGLIGHDEFLVQNFDS